VFIQTPKDKKMKIKNKLINLVSLKKMFIGTKSNLPYKNHNYNDNYFLSLYKYHNDFLKFGLPTIQKK
jgi:hypothetical protein